MTYTIDDIPWLLRKVFRTKILRYDDVFDSSTRELEVEMVNVKPVMGVNLTESTIFSATASNGTMAPCRQHDYGDWLPVWV